MGSTTLFNAVFINPFFALICFEDTKYWIFGPMLVLNTEKEGFLAYTAPEDAQRPRAVDAITPDFRGI